MVNSVSDSTLLALERFWQNLIGYFILDKQNADVNLNMVVPTASVNNRSSDFL